MKDVSSRTTSLGIVAIAVIAATLVPLTSFSTAAVAHANPITATGLPKAPAGWKLRYSKYENLSVFIHTGIVTVIHPKRIEVRLVGKLGHGVGQTNAEITRDCGNASNFYDSHRYSAGLYVVPVPKGASACDVDVFLNGTAGLVGIQILAQTNKKVVTTSTTTTTPPTTTTTALSKYPYDGTWTGMLNFTVTTNDFPPGVANYSLTLTGTVASGVFKNFTALEYGAASGSFSGPNNTADPTISSGGLVTPYFGGHASLDSASFGNCGVTIQFTLTTAQNTVPLSCQGLDAYPGGVTTLSNGTITLTRTGT